MSRSKGLIAELDQEMATTRRLLERYPEDKATYQPHPKSMTLARLASHIAELPGWAPSILKGDSFDIAPSEGPQYQPPTWTTRAEILGRFDQNVATLRQLLGETTDEAFGQPWTLKKGGQTVFTLPRAAVVRSMLFSHVIHHRGQLSVYLRVCDVPLPSIYGPTADEGH
jgi:uncharacterized damage-inducible protein DinB